MTVDGLKDWIEQSFTTHVGPPQSYYGWDADRQVALSNDEGCRGVYKVLGISAKVDAPAQRYGSLLTEAVLSEGAERKMVELLYTALNRLHIRALDGGGQHPGLRPHMVVRRPLSLQLPLPGDYVAKLSIRFDLPAIPKAVFGLEILEKPEGSPFKMVTEDGDVIDPPPMTDKFAIGPQSTPTEGA